MEDVLLLADVFQDFDRLILVNEEVITEEREIEIENKMELS